MKKIILTLFTYFIFNAPTFAMQDETLLYFKNNTSKEAHLRILAVGSDNYGSYEGQATPNAIPALKPQESYKLTTAKLASEYKYGGYKGQPMTRHFKAKVLIQDHFLNADTDILGKSFQVIFNSEKNSYELKSL